jgi:hypothetical protein
MSLVVEEVVELEPMEALEPAPEEAGPPRHDCCVVDEGLFG